MAAGKLFRIQSHVLAFHTSTQRYSMTLFASTVVVLAQAHSGAAVNSPVLDPSRLEWVAVWVLGGELLGFGL